MKHILIPPMPTDRKEVENKEDLYNMYFHCRKMLNNYYNVDYYVNGNEPDAVLKSEQSFIVSDWILMDSILKSDRETVAMML